MASRKSRLGDVSYGTWVALTFFLMVSLAIPFWLSYLLASEMELGDKLTMLQLAASILGFVGAVVAFSFALFQYRRSEQWKRTEFIACEVKEFESDPVIQNALLMIDWGHRDLNLFLRPEPKDADFIEITREAQWRALLPHTLKWAYSEYQALGSSKAEPEAEAGQKYKFSRVETRIRDTYDIFLTRLDRFASYIKSGLISPEELEPFISYWLDAMTKNEHPEKDAAWRCTLLTYINYYGYAGVKHLLSSYDKDISPDGPIYSALRSSMQDQVLADRLFEVVTPKQNVTSHEKA